MGNNFNKAILTNEIQNYVNKCNKIKESINQNKIPIIPLTIPIEKYIKTKYNDESKLDIKYNKKDIANVVYLIYTNDSPSKNDILPNIKYKRKNIKGMCRINDDNHATKKQQEKWKDLSKGNTHYLYVGGSSHFTKRLNEHLGHWAVDTSSLKINRWYKIWSPKINIKVVVWDLTGIFEKTLDKKEILAERQIIEDILYDTYQPLFGKKGPR